MVRAFLKPRAKRGGPTATTIFRLAKKKRATSVSAQESEVGALSIVIPEDLGGDRVPSLRSGFQKPTE